MTRIVQTGKPTYEELADAIYRFERARGIKGHEWDCPVCGEHLKDSQFGPVLAGHKVTCSLARLRHRIDDVEMPKKKALAKAVKAGLFAELGRLANDRGRKNEERLVRLMTEATPPAWVKAVRPGTKQEDANGIDIVVDTDVGALYLQVKSSKAAAAKWKPRGRRSIQVVVVRDEDTDATLVARAFGAIGQMRAPFVAERRATGCYLGEAAQ